MKNLNFLPILALIFLVACRSDPKKTEESQDGDAPAGTSAAAEKSIPLQLADANGFQHWKDVKELRFTFNADRGGLHFERSWIWEPKEGRVTAISGADTLAYFKGTMDSTASKRNSGFINDRYWLLAPFNLVWDAQNYDHVHATAQKAPISGEPMQKLTIVYKGEGGYTPGDAYDLYFGDDLIIREWVYRKSNQKEASLISTWEDYVEVEGLRLARKHIRKDGSPGPYFSGIEVKKQ